MNEFQEAAKALMAEKKMSEELVKRTITETIMAAYKKKYGTDENCEVEISEDFSSLEVYMVKTIVNDSDCWDSLTEMKLSDAISINEEAEIGDNMYIPVDPKTFSRVNVQNGKQVFTSRSREIERNSIYNEWSAKVGEIVVGYIVREEESKNGDVYVELGNDVEGILPHKHQNPTETYHKDDKMKFYVQEVNQKGKNVDIVLSRASSDFVKKLFELEIPKIADGTVNIYKCVRKAGVRTKIAVYTNKPDFDPVGACVGLKGARIQGIITEIGGEKIDVIVYDPQPELFVASSLSPATVKMVRIMDYEAKHIYAVVDKSQLAYAIGKGGINVILANKLTDWMIDVKTEEQYAELNLDKDVKSATEETEDGSQETEYDVMFKDLKLLTSVQAKLEAKNIFTISQFAELGTEDYVTYFGFNEEESKDFEKAISPYVEFEE